MKNPFSTAAFAAIATLSCTLASTTIATPAHAEWVASDNAWTGCVQTGGLDVPTFGVANGWQAIAVGCGAPDRDGDHPLDETTNLLLQGDQLIWGALPGAATSVAISPEGTKWAVTADGSIYRLDTDGKGRRAWTSIPGCASSIGVGAANAVWSIGCNANGPGGNIIQTWNGQAWITIPGAAARIAVSPEGTPWVITLQGGIYRWNAYSFAAMPGCARSIGVGANDVAWVIGCEASSAGGTAYVYSKAFGGWSQMGTPPQHGVRIAVTQDGTPWVADAQGKLHKWVTEKTWVTKQNGRLIVGGQGWAGPTVTVSVYGPNQAPLGTTTLAPLRDGSFTTTAAQLPLATCTATQPWTGNVWVADAGLTHGVSVICP